LRGLFQDSPCPGKRRVRHGEKRHIRSEGSGKKREFLGDKRLVEQDIHSLEHGGRIAAASPKACPVRNPLHQRNVHPVGNPRFLAEKFHRLDAEISGISRDLRIVAGQRDSVPGGMRDLDLIRRV